MSTIFDSTAGIDASSLNLYIQGLLVGICSVFVVLVISGCYRRLRSEDDYTPVNVVIDVGSSVALFAIVMYLMR